MSQYIASSSHTYTIVYMHNYTIYVQCHQTMKVCTMLLYNVEFQHDVYTVSLHNVATVPSNSDSVHNFTIQCTVSSNSDSVHINNVTI